MPIPAAKPLILIPSKSNNTQDTNNAIPVTSQVDPALLAPISPPLLQRQQTKELPVAVPISPPQVRTHSRTHSLTHSLTYSLTHLFL